MGLLEVPFSKKRNFSQRKKHIGKMITFVTWFGKKNSDGEDEFYQ